MLPRRWAGHLGAAEGPWWCLQASCSFTHLGQEGKLQVKGADSKRERGVGQGWEVLGCKTPKALQQPWHC